MSEPESDPPLSAQVPDLALLAYCGLYCGACSFRVAAEQNDRRHLADIPAKYDYLKEQELQLCPGCRLDDENDGCAIKDCARGKGLAHCGECPEYPCAAITRFADDGIPHHAKTIENIETLNRMGTQAWLVDQATRWSCACGARLSWYARECPRCRS
ncbi:DUF3795 domain-containing protein [Candidatus Fermentibacteria bacterium]|nr:DUF3795 domain-containing protein [Candidatus Fermentibacteria bacterium]